MFEDIRNEIKKRKKEEAASKEFIQAEIERLAEEREKSKRGIFRKIKVVDSIKSKSEQKKDNARIEKLKKEEEERLTKEKAERQREIIKKNSVKIFAGIIILACIPLGITRINGYINEQRIQKEYDNALSQIKAEEYSEASDTLLDIKVNDSESLIKYAEIMQNISSYEKAPKELLEQLENIGTINDGEIKERIQHIKGEMNGIIDLQDRIDSIDVTTIGIEDAEEVSGIIEEIKGIDPEFAGFINTDKSNSASITIDHLKNDTSQGRVIKAIRNLGEVTLETKSEIDEVRALYDALTDTEKEEVVNYSVLVAAESKYTSLKIEKELQEKKEQEEREAKERAEREAEERAQKEAEEAEKKAKEEAEAQAKQEAEDAARYEAWLDEIVYITESGDKYHLASCRWGSIELSRREAISRGYGPCGECNAWFEWYKVR